MFRTVLKIEDYGFRCFIITSVAFFLVVCTVFNPVQAATKGVQQKMFDSPEDAVKAFVDAVKSDDLKKMVAILGPHGKSIVSSGDDIADKEIRDEFIKLYDEKYKIDLVTDTKAVLSIGEKDWPLPIPMVKKGTKWSFDSKTGKEEILNRRIGKNELAVIKVCEAYVDAQQEFALMDTDGDGIFEYAQKFVSSAGQKDGLFWPTKEGEKPSPLGPFAARARSEGYTKKSTSEKPQPYHGYFYKIMKGQGKNAKGGAYDYVVNGNMIGGFALVAYPAQYGSSGVMTFIVNHDAVVYQKNIGKDTAKIAQAMKVFDPDKTWKKVETQ